MAAFSTRRKLLAALALTTTCLSGIAHAGAPLPMGGIVSSGNAQIGTNGTTTTVTQTSAKAVVNWQGFDVGAGNAVVFAQPNAQAATLNRVTGATTSTIAGSITSNGAVYLVNPNGIAITSTGSVQTGGGFIASTLDIADGDFTAGKLNFTGNGASKGVTNAGNIAAGSGAYVALLGGSVSNSGTISVPLAKVGLGSGESIALDLNGDGFMQVAVPSNLATSGIDMSGSITAAGGRVELRAAAVRGAIRNIVNVPGSISADSATGDGGSIVLLANGGTLNATGTLTARATGAIGNGGTIETSGNSVNFAGLKVDTSATGGKTGSWLVDPTDLTVDAAAATTIQTNLATSNVTLQTDGTTATGPGNQTPGNGDINIAAPVTWTSTNTLSLLAYNNIALNAAITGTAGGLTLTAGNNVANTGAISATGAVKVGTFNLTNGAWTQNSATLPTFTATDFRFNPANATFLRVTGGTGASATPYQIADIYGLQGIASGTLLANSFTLANSIDASGTATWNAGVGFIPIGTDGAGALLNRGSGFMGVFDGQRQIITGLTINRGSFDNVGLFGLAGSAISNIALTGTNIAGGSNVGGIVGYYSGGSITNASVGGSVFGQGDSLGGLVGYADASSSIGYSSTSGSVTHSGAIGDFVGGLVGLAAGSISNSYSSSTVVGGTTSIGGLVGQQTGAIANVYATGSVTGGSASTFVGGLVGRQGAYGTLTSAYATGQVSGGTYVGGLLGRQAGTASNAYWDSYSTGQANAVGYQDSIATSTNVTAVTSDPNAPGSSTAYLAGSYANLSAASGIGTAAPTGFVFMLGNITRPFLAFEVPTSSSLASTAGGSLLIANSHQLQLIGLDDARLAQNYALVSDLNLGETGAVVLGTPGSYSGMWAGTGFVPIGRLASSGPGSFTGSLDGQNHVLNALTIHDTAIIYVGLFGFSGGAISNLGLVGVNVSGPNSGAIGGLVGQAYGGSSIANSYVTGTVTGLSSASNVGGLVGYISGAISNSYSGATVSGGSVVGGLVGNESTNATLTNVYATGTVSGSSSVGGLAGQGAAITNAYATGTVTGSGNNVGGLVGLFSSPNGSLASAYATGSVSSTGTYVGGLVGRLSSGMVGSVYATGTVNGGAQVGGLVGYQSGGKINGAYATGYVTGSVATTGGLVGQQLLGLSNNRTSLSNAYWDAFSTNQSVAIGSAAGAVATTGSVTSDPNAAGGPTAFAMASYANLPVANNVGTATPTGFAFVAGDTTRPFLAFEVPTAAVAGSAANGSVLLSSSHQLQLIGYNGPSLSGSYALANAIDLSETSANAGTAATSAGMWAGTGFVPIGTDGAGNVWNGTAFVAGGTTGFSGSLDGKGFALSNLKVARPSTNFIGLIGTSTGSIANVKLTGASVTGNAIVAPLVGNMLGGSVTGSSAAGSVGGNYFTGGLIGNQSAGAITSSSSSASVVGNTAFTGGLLGQQAGGTLDGSSATGAVSGGADLGGLIGYQYATAGKVTTSSATGNVSGTTNVGGLVGYSEGSIATSTASGTVTGGSFIGGLVGRAYSGNISGSSTATTSIVTGTGNDLGGLIGYQDNGSSVTSGTARGAVNGTGSNSYVGGLIGAGYGTVAMSGAMGAVTGKNYVGGAFGATGGTAAISNTSASGPVSGTTFTGGFVGVASNTGSFTGSSAAGNVSGTTDTGGFVGYLVAGSTITGSLASGAITGTGDNIGGFAGYSEGSIATSTASGAVTGGSFIGGLVGRAYSGNISGSSTATTSIVTGTGNDLGGLIGYQDNGSSVTSGTARGAVNGTGSNSYVGGLIGAGYGTVAMSGAMGAVTGKNYVGGAFGATGGTAAISNTSASGPVSGTTFTGGFVGVASNTGSFTGSSAAGNVSGTTDTGGFVGYLVAGSTITGSSASGTVTASGDNTGGFAGYSAGSLSSDYAVGATNGARFTGGFAGSVTSGAVLATDYATGAVTGSSDTGGLVGAVASGTSVTGSHATGDISGTGNNVGGLIGTSAGQISGSYAIGATTGVNNVGGLIGTRLGGDVTNADASGTVSGTNAVGGLIGLSQGSGSLTSIKATGNVLGDLYVGGLIGQQSGGDIADAYATGTYGRNGSSTFVGGLIGYQDGGTATRTYAIGTGNGANYGGLVGYQTGSASITASVWNTQTSEKLNGFGYQNGSPTFSAIGETTTQMQDPANTATNYPGWDFTNTWIAPSSGVYPKLKRSVAH